MNISSPLSKTSYSSHRIYLCTSHDLKKSLNSINQLVMQWMLNANVKVQQYLHRPGQALRVPRG
jgi:hypothetical protein